ncbi:hypothetical protein [Staphylococcus hominis]
MNNWPEIIVTSLSSGTVVAFVNHFLQSRRKKQEIKFENKSVLIREKMKIIYEVNKDFNKFNNVTSNAYIAISEYMRTPLENKDEEEKKLYQLLKKIGDSNIKEEDYLQNLNINLNYFPKVKETVNENHFFGLQRKVVLAHYYGENIENSYSIKRMKGELDEKAPLKLENDYKKFNEAKDKVLDALNLEVQEIYSYLGNAK